MTPGVGVGPSDLARSGAAGDGRMILRRGVVAGIALAIGFGRPNIAQAVGLGQARVHVEETIEEILELIVAGKTRAEIAATLKRIIEERSALPQLARFISAGYWPSMTDDQQERFTEALSLYVAHVYAGYFRAYEGGIDRLRSHVAVIGAEEAGAKGVVVRSEIRPFNEVAVPIIWLVSDRSGRVAVSDLVVGGISMALTQRDIVQGMFRARGGDVELTIRFLRDEAGRAIAASDRVER